MSCRSRGHTPVLLVDRFLVSLLRMVQLLHSPRIVPVAPGGDRRGAATAAIGAPVFGEFTDAGLPHFYLLVRGTDLVRSRVFQQLFDGCHALLHVDRQLVLQVRDLVHLPHCGQHLALLIEKLHGVFIGHGGVQDFKAHGTARQQENQRLGKRHDDEHSASRLHRLSAEAIPLFRQRPVFESVVPISSFSQFALISRIKINKRIIHELDGIISPCTFYENNDRQTRDEQYDVTRTYPPLSVYYQAVQCTTRLCSVR